MPFRIAKAVLYCDLGGLGIALVGENDVMNWYYCRMKIELLDQ